jgi:hypothetical protein
VGQVNQELLVQELLDKDLLAVWAVQMLEVVGQAEVAAHPLWALRRGLEFWLAVTAALV